MNTTSKTPAIVLYVQNTYMFLSFRQLMSVLRLIGPTGSGKSTVSVPVAARHHSLTLCTSQFANKVSGAKYETEGIISCTQDINLAPPFLLDGRKVTLVDTPGLDDTFKSTSEIFGLIAEFLKAT